MNNDLLGGLRRDAPEGGGVHLGAKAVAHLTLRIEFAALFDGDLQVGFGDLVNDFLELKDLDLPAFFIVVGFNIDFGTVSFARRGTQCLFQSLDENLSVNALVTADLFDNAFYI